MAETVSYTCDTHTHDLHIFLCLRVNYGRKCELHFEHIELPAKLLDYVLRSDKSNINLSHDTHTHDAGST